MPLLPPDHVTLPFAATYLAAAILHDNHNGDPELRAPAPFGACRLTVTRMAPRLAPNGQPLPSQPERRSLVSNALRIHAGDGPTKVADRPARSRRDPTGFQVTVSFKERDGRTLYTRTPGFRPSAVTTLEMTLTPSVIGCLSPIRLRAGLNVWGLASIAAPLPDSLHVSVFAFEEQLVMRYRQVLAEGHLGAVLVDGSGRSVSIPAAYWREDRASAALVEAHAIAMVLDGQEMRGHVCVNLSALREGWRAAFAALPVSVELAEAELSATAARVGTAPLLEIALRFAREFGIVDGRGEDGLPINSGELEGLLLERWKPLDELGVKRNTNRLELFSTLLRHPSDKPGPKSAYTALRKARGLETQPAETIQSAPAK